MGERYDLHTLALMTANAVQDVLEDGGEDGPLLAQDCIKDVLRVERQAREAAEAERDAVFNLAMQYLHEYEPYPTTCWCGVDVEVNQLSHDPECPLCADDTAELVRRLLLWTKMEHDWQAERAKAGKAQQERDVAEAELAELRKRVACCEQCAQSVIDPACIFCGHEPDTTEGGEHG